MPLPAELSPGAGESPGSRVFIVIVPSGPIGPPSGPSPRPERVRGGKESAMKPLASLAVTAILVFLAGGQPIAAQQEERDPRFVRETLYQLNFADMEAWNATYREHVVPVLRELEQEGLIQGFGAQSHDTGGEYNWRFGIRFFDWASIETGLDAFFSRLGQRIAPARMAEVQRMVRSHQDNIWEIAGVSFREGAGPTSRVYVAEFQVNAADLEGWLGFFERTWRPALARVMEAGHLNGWVALRHAHGGPYSWQVMYFAPSWDTIDDAWDGVFEGFQSDPEAFQRALRMVEAHRDNIWIPVSLEMEGS